MRLIGLNSLSSSSTIVTLVTNLFEYIPLVPHYLAEVVDDIVILEVL
jgi:hypothetical protein